MAFISGVGNNFSQKNKDTAETIKLNGLIRDEEEKLNDLYLKLGKLYFELHNETFDPDLEEFITNIKESKTNIDKYAEQIIELKNAPRCPKCNNRISKDATFCGICGYKTNPQDEVELEDTKTLHCMKCGAPVSTNSSFCTKCGTKVVFLAAPTSTSAPKTKFCKTCGKIIAENAKFCIGCGSII